MKSNPRKQTHMCKCINLEKLDIQYDENEFHRKTKKFFLTKIDPNTDN